MEKHPFVRLRMGSIISIKKWKHLVTGMSFLLIRRVLTKAILRGRACSRMAPLVGYAFIIALGSIVMPI